ncbi:alpha/beta fold hydrolase [Streptomyces althioticus]
MPGRTQDSASTGGTAVHAGPSDGWGRDPEDARLERCAIEVPLDYDDPDGERITLAVTRIRALDPARRRGVLVGLNGGPGGNQGLGRFMPLRLADTPVHEVYDLIGFDPRGWGASAPLMREVVQGKAPWSSRPSDEEFAQLAEDMRAVEEGAARAGGALRAHITTRNVARDLDRIRRTLGEDRISYLGYAYGTYLGSVYASMFGEHLDRHVFDSCVDPGAVWRGQYTSQAEAIRANVDAWAAWAGERDGVFGLGTDGDAVIASVERLAAALHACPVGGVDRTVLDGAVGNGATHRPLWDQLAWLVVALTAGDARAAQTAWLLAAPDGEQPKPGDTHVPGLVEATTCEGVWSRDLETYFADMRDFRDRCPYGYGVSRAQPWVATFRTDRPREAMTVLRGDDCAPGLIVAAEGNPTLAHRGGRAMATLFGDRLVTVADDGSNEMFAVRGNIAVDALVTAYFVDGRLPDTDVTVAGTPRPAPEATAAQDGPGAADLVAKGPDAQTVGSYLAAFRAAAARP